MRKIALILGGAVAVVVVLLLVVLLLGGKYFNDVYLDGMATKAADMNARHREAFLADQQALRGHWLVTPTGEGDASTILSRVPLQWADRPRGALDALGVPDALYDRLMEKDWLTDTSIDVAGADLAWMRELQRYQYWDLGGLPHDRSAIELPLPDTRLIKAAARARLLQGLQTGDVAAAVEDVRALARLEASTEIFFVAIQGVILLGPIIETVALAKERGLLSADGPVDDETTRQRLMRSCRGARGAFDLAPSPTGVESEVSVCACAGLSDALVVAGLARPHYEHHLGERYATLDKMVAQSQCRMPLGRFYWEQGKTSTAKDLLKTACSINPDGRPFFCASSLSAHLAIVRLGALVYMQLEIPFVWTSGYEEAKAKPLAVSAPVSATLPP